MPATQPPPVADPSAVSNAPPGAHGPDTVWSSNPPSRVEVIPYRGESSVRDQPTVASFRPEVRRAD